MLRTAGANGSSSHLGKDSHRGQSRAGQGGAERLLPDMKVPVDWHRMAHFGTCTRQASVKRSLQVVVQQVPIGKEDQVVPAGMPMRIIQTPCTAPGTHLHWPSCISAEGCSSG